MLAAEQQSALQVAVRNTPPSVAGRHMLLVVFQQRIPQEEAGSKHQEETARHTPLAEDSTRIGWGDLEPLQLWEEVCRYTLQVAVGKELFWVV
jgi:hypothetical protein